MGLLTRAIDLITDLRRQLAVGMGGGGGGGSGGPLSLPLPPFDLDDGVSLPDIAAFPSLPPATPARPADGKKRGAGGRRRAHLKPPQQQQQQQHHYHHSAAEESPVLARSGSKKLAADSCVWVEVPILPMDALAKCFSAAPKAAFSVLGCLDPGALATGRAVARSWRDWHSQVCLNLRLVCVRIFTSYGPNPIQSNPIQRTGAALARVVPPALAPGPRRRPCPGGAARGPAHGARPSVLAPGKDGAMEWLSQNEGTHRFLLSRTHEQVYTFHHRARLPPRGPFTPTPCAHNRPLLAHASAHGLAAWLFLGPLPPSSAAAPPPLLPFRLLLQNHGHDAALVPYQRLRLVAAATAASASAAPMDDANGAPIRGARTISALSVGTSLAASSSSSSASEGEEGEEEAVHVDVDDFFLHEEKGEEAPAAPAAAVAVAAAKQQAKPQRKQPKQAGAVGPCVVARNERQLEGGARIPWRRFKVSVSGGIHWESWMVAASNQLTRLFKYAGHGGRAPAPRPLRHGPPGAAPAAPRRLPPGHAPPRRPARHVRRPAIWLLSRFLALAPSPPGAHSCVSPVTHAQTGPRRCPSPCWSPLRPRRRAPPTARRAWC